MTAALWNSMVEQAVAAATAASIAPADAPPKVNGHPAVPVAIPAPEDLRPDPGEVLSPSQANTFLDCPARWRFRYQIGLPDPPNGARHLGRAVHKAAEFHHRFRLNEGQPPAAPAVEESYELAWHDELGAVEWRDDENPDELRSTGRAMVSLYLRDIAPRLEPAAVEVRVDGLIGGVPVRGQIDLLDVEGRIIDLKTAAKAPSGIRPDYRLQVATYDLLCPDSRGVARLDTLTKTRRIASIEQTVTLGPGDVQYIETIYPMVRDAIRDGLFYPRRDSLMCSRKWCPYWRECEREFGGEVK